MSHYYSRQFLILNDENEWMTWKRTNALTSLFENVLKCPRRSPPRNGSEGAQKRGWSFLHFLHLFEKGSNVRATTHEHHHSARSPGWGHGIEQTTNVDNLLQFIGTFSPAPNVFSFRGALNCWSPWRHKESTWWVLLVQVCFRTV